MHSPPGARSPRSWSRWLWAETVVLELRRDQMATVREVIEGLTDETLIADRTRLSR